MRLLIVTPAYYPDKTKGGSVTGCVNFVKSITFSNIDATVITLNTTSQKDKVQRVFGVETIYFNKLNFLSKLSKSDFGFSFEYLFWMISNVDKYDVVYFRSIWNFVSFIGPIICIFKGKRYGFCASGKLNSEALASAKFKKVIFTFLSGIIFKKAKFVHFASSDESTSNSFELLRYKKELCLPPSFEKYEVVNAPIFENIIYSVSRVDPYKNIHLNIQLLSKLNSGLKKFRYIHFGNYDTEYYSFLVSECERFNLTLSNVLEDAADVYFLGFKSKIEVDSIVGSESIFLLSSKSEGFSNSLIEALNRKSKCLVKDSCNVHSLAEKGLVKEFSSVDTALNTLLNINFERADDETLNSYLQEVHSKLKQADKIETFFNKL